MYHPTAPHMLPLPRHLALRSIKVFYKVFPYNASIIRISVSPNLSHYPHTSAFIVNFMPPVCGKNVSPSTKPAGM